MRAGLAAADVVDYVEAVGCGAVHRRVVREGRSDGFAALCDGEWSRRRCAGGDLDRAVMATIGREKHSVKIMVLTESL